MPEIWKLIPGWEKYEVSDIGGIRRRIAGRGTNKDLSVKGYARRGYLEVDLRDNGRRWTIQIGQLILTTFVGPCPEGLQCRHLDDNKHNNKLSNLKWGTCQENRMDAIRNGTANIDQFLKAGLHTRWQPGHRLSAAQAKKKRQSYMATVKARKERACIR